MLKTAWFKLFGQRGAGRKVKSDGRVRFDPTMPGRDRAIDAVLARVARESRCGVQSRLDCWAMDGSAATWEITLLKPAKGGGYNIEGSLWATVGRDA